MSAIRAAHARLLGVEDGAGHRALVAIIRIVIDRYVPRLVMFDGEPFLLVANLGPAGLIYGQERPFRADPGSILQEGSR